MSGEKCFEPKNGTKVSHKEMYECMGQFEEKVDAHLNSLITQVNRLVDVIDKKVEKVDTEFEEHKNSDRTMKLIFLAVVIILCTIYPAALTYVPKAIAAII